MKRNFIHILYAKVSLLKLSLLLICTGIVFVSNVFAVTNNTDPPRAGSPLPGLTADEQHFFDLGKEDFEQLQSVKGTEPGAPELGLGPRFNANGCAVCHSQPATGGTSPAMNPQFPLATRFGARNQVPFFVTATGPVREARFKFNPDGSRDGGVHDIYVITGRADAVGCNIAQPNFDNANANMNLAFRIPTPVFGAGLIEAIDDATIRNNMNADRENKRKMGIKGHENQLEFGLTGLPNTSDNDGTITRFGWKAQNKSLMLFAGEAYNVEQGVTNELFVQERDETPGCQFNEVPENHTNFSELNRDDFISDIQKFTFFMRFLAPPTPKPLTDNAKAGQQLFNSTGCSLCHTPMLRTGNSSTAALKNKEVNLYSDLLVHAMGPGLADNIVQGRAGPDEFRTAPLWGVSQRLFFLHDGRTSDLMEAILQHASSNPNCRPSQDKTPDGISCNSEANAVISKFRNLSNQNKNKIIAFLQSL